MRRRGVLVCMVAYTEYAGDARVRREAETLAAHGFDVRCLCLRTEHGRGRGRYRMDGVEVQELPVRKYRGKRAAAYLLSYLRFLAAASAACARLMVTRHLDVVHVHNLPDFLVLAGLVPRLAGARIVLDVHDSMSETFATKFARRPIVWKVLCSEERLSTLLADQVICVNDVQRDTLVARGLDASKVFVSLNAPDPRIFRSPAVAVTVKRAEPLNLVYHGTMARRLGVDLVIRALSRLRGGLSNACLHLWGHGDDLAEFQALTRDLGLDTRVCFEPNGVPLHELPQRLRPMDIGVIGNRRTAAGELMLPVKLLEYVSLGIPAVAPRLKTIAHYFGEDMVAYYEPDDIDSLADAICRLSCQPDARAKQAARAREVLDTHGWERRGAEFVGFYRSILGR